MEVSTDLFKKLMMELLYEPTIPLLGMYLKECKSACNGRIYTSRLVAVLLTMAKLWNLFRSPTANEWIKNV
jgi:hypothetical protein